MDDLLELQPFGKQVLSISRGIEAVSECLAKSLLRCNVWCLCLDRVAYVHNPKSLPHCNVWSLCLGRVAYVHEPVRILQLSVPLCLRNSLELQTGDLKLHVFCHLRTCKEVCGKTAKPRVNILAIHLAHKFR
jgi:hypothetical protein